MENTVNGFATEEQFQAFCTQWFHNTYIQHRGMLFHVQQSAKNKMQGAKFKAIGVRAGVADLIFIGFEKVVFIELKLPQGQQSPIQREFAAKVRERGHRYEIVRSAIDFVNLIKELIHG